MKKIISLLSLILLFASVNAQIISQNGSMSNIGANIKSINTPDYVVAGNTNITGTINNTGTTAIASFDLTYKVDGGVISKVCSFSGLNIAPNATYNFTHNVSANLSVGQHSVETFISNINGSNDVITNNVSKKNVTVVSSTVTKRVFCEEATGTWCGYCVRGIVNMDNMAINHPNDWVGVAVHNGDPMKLPAWDGGATTFPGFTGFPTIIVDRTILTDPSNAETSYTTQKAVVAPVDVAIENVSYNSSNKLLNFTIKATSATTATVNWNINGALSEMDVTYNQNPSVDSAGYQQHNYYSGGSLGAMGGFENLPSVIPANYMHYNFVGRALMGGFTGTTGIIPASVTDGTSYSKSYTYLIPSTMDAANVNIIGFVIDQTSGKVLNSIQSSVFAGIPETHTTNLRIFPNPSKGFVTIDGLNSKSKITVSNLFGETVKYVENTNTIDLSNFANGIYFVKIDSDNHIITKKIILNK